MGRQTTSTPGARLWPMFLNSVVFLAIALFLEHAVVAGGFLPHAHGQTAAPAKLSLTSSDAAEVFSSHDHAEAMDQKYHTAGGTPACCGDACLVAVMPDEGPGLHREGQVGSKFSVLVSLLSGRALEGPRHPPQFPA